MKLKQRPEDFIVRELDALSLGEGPFAVYRLCKRGIGTIEAVSSVGRILRVPRAKVSFGGLKDKWAVTEQAISIEGGPKRGVRTARFELEYLGQSPRPVRRDSFERNRFEITFRDLIEGDARHLRRSLDEVVRFGLPNYFDSQRFGSARGAPDFIGRRLLRRDFEGALRLAIATPSPGDRSRERRIKGVLAANWGRWEELLRRLPEGPERKAVSLLARRPGAFRAAFERLDPALRRLQASAYQSWLWNRCVERLIRRHAPTVIEKKYAMGRLAFYRELPSPILERLRSLRISLFHKGAEFSDPEVRTIVEEILREEGFALDDLKIPGDTGLGRGVRSVLMFPENVSAAYPEPDELNPGRLRVTVSFELPRGSYATILVKRIFH